MPGVGALLDQSLAESSDAPSKTSVGDLLDRSLGEAPDADLTASTAPSVPPAKTEPGKPVSRIEKFARGVGDMATGTAQLLEHVPGVHQGLDLARAGIRAGMKAAGASEPAYSLFNPVDTAEFDKVISDNEKTFQARRQKAGETGIDWWRIGGNVANPVNYVGPGAATTAGGRILAATGMGAAQGVLQPSANEGDFWTDKAKGAAVGALSGAALSSATEAVGAGVRLVRSAGKEVSDEASDAVTDAIAKGAAQNSGVDPAKVDPGVLSAMKQEAQEAIDKGVAPSEKSIFNRAVANSLPEPVNLTRGQATRDPLQYAKEFALKQVEGVGEPLAYNEQAQNRALIENLNRIGAKDAPDVVSAGQALTSKIAAIDDGLTTKINAAYKAVRNSAGQPASMDGKAFAESLLSTLEARDLPETIQSTLREIADGKLPLNVETAQYLDRAWSGLQSGKGSYGVSTTADRAIQKAKAALLDTDVVDAAGEESIAAYKVAKGLAKQRFDLIDANPAYKAVVNGARNAEPDQFFRKFVMGATAREADGLRKLVTAGDPDMDAMLGKTLLGEIKAGSLNGTEENGAFSASKFGKFLDSVWQAKLSALLPDGAVQTLKNLHYVAELVQRAPVASVPNRSGTAATAGNLVMSAMKAGASEKLAGLLSKVPGVSSAMKTAAEGAAAARTARGVQEALNPGVTASSVPAMGPAAREFAKLSTAAGTAGAVEGARR